MLHQLGAGVLGPVFRAVGEVDETGERTRAAAVKVFVFDFTPERSQECGRLFRQLAASQTAHPSLVRIIEAGTEGSLVYLAQDYVSGVPLDARLRDRGPLSADDALAVLGQLADAIDASARAGVLHGRLHPRDILVSLPHVWVTGHGVAEVLEECGVSVPTRRPYTAPERQIRQPWDSRADVYSLGALAYELMTGRRIGTTGDASMLAAATSLDPALRDVFTRAMSTDPEARFGTGAELVDALAAATIPTVAVPDVAGAGLSLGRGAGPAAADVEEPSELLTSGPDLFVASGFSWKDDAFSTVGADLVPSREARFGETHRSLGGGGHVDPADDGARGFGWMAAAALLLVGVTLGFAGGYGAAVRGWRPSPSAPEPVAAKNNAPVVSAREWTDGAVTEPPKAVEAPPPAPVREQPVVRPKRQPTEARSNDVTPISEPVLRNPAASSPDTRGVIAVRTRPEGARVFLNGRAVGTAPLVLTDVAAGSHRVGLELPGYQRWTSMVRVGSGTRHSVTASLERVR